MKLLIFIFITLIHSPAFSLSKKELLKNTGLLEGNYTLENDDSRCLSGDLNIFEIDGSLSLMLGDKALVLFLDKTEFTEKERECTFSYKNEISKGKIKGLLTQACKKKALVTREVDLRFSDKKLTYKNSIKSKDRNESFTCKLKGT